MKTHLSVTCQCGLQKEITASQAGTTQICPACHSKLNVPRLSELKQQPAGSAIGVSKLEQLIRSIQDQHAPFDGTCQLCLHSRGTNYLPVTVGYFADEGLGRFSIPCAFCDLCASDVRSGLRAGTLRNMAKNLAKCIWLLFMLPVVMFVAMVLPFIGIFFVIGIMSALFYQVTRRRANPYLLTHLDRICHFNDAMDDIEEYVVKWGRMQIGQPVPKAFAPAVGFSRSRRDTEMADRSSPPRDG